MRFNTFEAANNKVKKNRASAIGPINKSPNFWALVDAVENLEPRKRKTFKKRLLPSIALKAGNQKQKC